MPLRSRSMQPSTASRMLVRVDAYAEGQMRGRVYSPFLGKGAGFADFVDMVNKMDGIFDLIGYPQANMEYRSFHGSAAPREDIEKRLDGEEVREDETGLFVVHVQMRQNADWQGIAAHRGRGGGHPFKSTMELLKFIDGSMVDDMKVT